MNPSPPEDIADDTSAILSQQDEGVPVVAFPQALFTAGLETQSGYFLIVSVTALQKMPKGGGGNFPATQ